MPKSEIELRAGALAGDREAARDLVELVYPVVQARVARVLLRSGRGARREIRQEIEDMTQDVFAFLFEQRGKGLAAWDPSRGLSLRNFVGLLAERHVVSILRSGRKSPFTEDPTLPSEIGRDAEPVPSPEPAAVSRDLLATLLDRLRVTLSPLGMHLFQLMYVDELSVEEIARSAKMTPDAIYAWRSRLRKVVSTLAAELAGGAAPAGFAQVEAARGNE